MLANLRDDQDPRTTELYAAEISAAFADINPVLLDVVETASRWTTGDATDDELAGALDVAVVRVPVARDAVAALDEPRAAAPAEAMYLASVDLYAIAVEAFRAALAVSGDERTEMALLARRVRTIADRVYDRGRALVDPSSIDGAPGITVVRSDPVPDWDAEGLAAASAAGADLDADARRQPDDEAGRRRALHLLVLAEVAQARELDNDALAAALDAVAEMLAP